MRKVLLMMVCVWMISGLVSAQSRWSITPEAGITAVQRVGTGGWRPGVKVGANLGYQFEPKWIGIKAGLFYTNRGHELGDYPISWETDKGEKAYGMIGGQITQHFLQLPVMADFSWKVKNVRMHLGVGMYAAVSMSNAWEWGYSTIYYPHSGATPNGMYGGYNPGYPGYELEYDVNPFSGQSSFDWGLTTSFGIEVENWVMNVGYDLSLGDEGDGFRSVGSNYNTLSLTVGYKFKLGK